MRRQVRARARRRCCFLSDTESTGTLIPADFIGLSYESALLTSSDYFTPRNPSVFGLLRTFGTSGVLRIGGNTSERTVWSTAGSSSPIERFLITPAAIDALAALLRALGWRLIYGLNLARGTPESAADEAAYVANAVGPRLLAFQISNEPDGFGRWSAGVRQATMFRLYCRVAALPLGDPRTPAGRAICGPCGCRRNRLDCTLRRSGSWQSGAVDSALLL
jgi:hypothetical protein